VIEEIPGLGGVESKLRRGVDGRLRKSRALNVSPGLVTRPSLLMDNAQFDRIVSGLGIVDERRSQDFSAYTLTADRQFDVAHLGCSVEVTFNRVARIIA
jgi:hypothetical protein